MQQQKIDFAQAQPHQAVASRTFKLARGKMRRPDFRRHEQIVALDAGRTQAIAHLALVIVHFRSVDVAIAEPQSLLDHTRAGAPAQFPGAEAEQRNFSAVGLDRRDGSDRDPRSHTNPIWALAAG